MLTLVGHYNPVGEYPAPVVPICRDERERLFAVYTKGRRLRPLAVPATLEFAPLSGLSDALNSFRAHRHGLFALSHDDVRVFVRAERGHFLRHLFGADQLRFANPFLALSLSRLISDMDAISAALRCSIAELGGVDDFTDNWYKTAQTHYRLRELDLPATLEEFTRGMTYLRLGSSDDKLQLARRLGRGFNADARTDRFGHTQQVAIVAFDEHRMMEDSEAASVDAIIAETDLWENAAQDAPNVEAFPFGQGKLVLALNPEFARTLQPDQHDWRAVLRAAASRSEFRWIRGRSGTTLGTILDGLLVEALRSREAIDEADLDVIRQLEHRVFRYCPNDVDAIQTAIVGDEWRVEAFVAQAHSLQSLLPEMPVRRRPVVLPSPRSEMTIPTSLVAVDAIRAPVRSILRSFCQSLTLDRSQSEIERCGMSPGATRLAALNSARAASERIGYQRPVAVCLVADTSGSMRGAKLAEAKVGMSALIGRLSEDRNDALGMVGFSTAAVTLVPMRHVSQSADAVGAAIASLEANGETALFDALMLAHNELRSWEEHLRAIVLLTDGRENRSRTSRADALQELRSGPRNSVMVFGLAYGSDADMCLLEEIAEIAGGAAYYGTVTNVSKVFSRLATQL